MTEAAPPTSPLRQVRILLWVLILLAIAGAAALILMRDRSGAVAQNSASAHGNFGGPFNLLDGDGKPFSSQALEGKPYAIYFGFTRCGNACPTTLSRLVKLRRETGDEQALHIVFVTIDPAHDGPKQVGQYAELFGSPIIGLTGSQAQIDQIKKEYGIFAQPNPHPTAGMEMEHTTTVLLFDRAGKFVATIAPDEPDSSALAKLKSLVAA